MPISSWSTTANDNDDADAAINWLENQAPSTVNNSARAMMAAIRTWYEDVEWRNLGHVVTRTGATTFTIPTDVTTTYVANRPIRCADSSTLYGYIASSSYSAPNTTVTVTLDSGSLSASLSSVALGPTPTTQSIPVQAIRNQGAALLAANNTWTGIADFTGGFKANGTQLPAGAALVGNAAANGVTYRAIPGINAIINGCCRVAQRTAPNISNAYQYGQVDRFAAKADGTVGAGTISQTTSANCGRTGYALKLAGVTLSAGGEAVYVRYRMESLDARQFKNQTAIFHCKVYHDVGSAKNFTITVNKANAANDFSAVTNIGASGNQSVNSATETTISYSVAMGDCSNGIEVIVKCDCGAITTKNFEFTEMQFEQGAVATDFERIDYMFAELKAMRYYEALADGNGNNRIWSPTETVGNGSSTWFFKTRKRAIPTLAGTYYNTIDTASPDHISLTSTAGNTSYFNGNCTADAEL